MNKCNEFLKNAVLFAIGGIGAISLIGDSIAYDTTEVQIHEEVQMPQHIVFSEKAKAELEPVHIKRMNISAAETPTNASTDIIEEEIELPTEELYEYVPIDVPEGDTSFFAYMDGKTITNKESAQYCFIQKCRIDDNGLYRMDDDYVVAMGSYYSTYIGQRFRVTLDNGNSFFVSLGDCKSDVHTDDLHQYRAAGYNGTKKNVVEFIVDTKSLDNEVAFTGNVGAYPFFKGNIASIERVDERG